MMQIKRMQPCRAAAAFTVGSQAATTRLRCVEHKTANHAAASAKTSGAYLEVSLHGVVYTLLASSCHLHA